MREERVTLKEYQGKRNFRVTPEPKGKTRPGAPVSAPLAR